MVTNKIIESEDKLRVINIGLDGFAKEPITSIEQTRELFRNLVEKRRAAGIDIPAE